MYKKSNLYHKVDVEMIGIMLYCFGLSQNCKVAQTQVVLIC